MQQPGVVHQFKLIRRKGSIHRNFKFLIVIRPDLIFASIITNQ